MRTGIAAAAAASVVLLSGCDILSSTGGNIVAPLTSAPIDLTGTTTPVQIDSVDTGARLAAALGFSIIIAGAAEEEPVGGGTGGTGPAVPPPARSKLHWAGSWDARATATTTRNCNGGGTSTFTTDDSTLFAADGQQRDRDCVEIFSQGGVEQARETSDGLLLDRCTDPAQATNQCHAFQRASGEGEEPYVLVFRDASDEVRLALRVGSTYSETIQGTQRSASDETFNGAVQFDDLRAQESVTLAFDSYRLQSSFAATSTSFTTTGTLGVGRNAEQTLTNCASGRFGVQTPTPVTVNHGTGAAVAGRWLLSGANGTNADVLINSDSSVTVTVNGASRTFTKPQFDALCS